MARHSGLAACVVGILLMNLSFPGVAAGMKVDINFVLGGKALDEDDWDDDADSQGMIGIETTFGNPGWPVAVALDYLLSGQSDERVVTSPVLGEVDLLQATAELDAGVRKIWTVGRARPFVGGGLGILTARQETNVGLRTIDEQDGTVGIWLNGGCFWRLTRRFNLGVDLRLSAGEVELFGRDVSAGGNSLGLLLGWGWGGQSR
ncbi:MAG TPA: hypothetical protein VD788_17920 [Candidatus Polarisedimenticolaceae bacterium]|nr:hypothetical protein [Candidatus Polarisedimenticolaceae bacterium]